MHHHRRPHLRLRRLRRTGRRREVRRSRARRHNHSTLQRSGHRHRRRARQNSDASVARRDGIGCRAGDRPSVVRACAERHSEEGAGGGCGRAGDGGAGAAAVGDAALRRVLEGAI